MIPIGHSVLLGAHLLFSTNIFFLLRFLFHPSFFLLPDILLEFANSLLKLSHHIIKTILAFLFELGLVVGEGLTGIGRLSFEKGFAEGSLESLMAGLEDFA